MYWLVFNQIYFISNMTEQVRINLSIFFIWFIQLILIIRSQSGEVHERIKNPINTYILTSGSGSTFVFVLII